MDKIILGLLMLKRFNMYEIRNVIKTNFGSMCSDGWGSIQAAIKKLLATKMISYVEYVEKGVNKKQYAITEKGREALLHWVKTPADMTNTKNMELGKLFNMGLVPAPIRLTLIEEIIAALEKDLEEAYTLQSSIQLADAKKQGIMFFESDPEYSHGIQKATQTNITDSINSIAEFQMLTLQYSIDFTKFQIKWFGDLKERMLSTNA